MSDDTRERSTRAARDASAPPNGSDRNQTMMRPDGHLDAEMVSAWLDTPDDFSADDRLTIEGHLSACAECRQIAAELTAIVRAFQTLPFVEAPRSFALTTQMAGLTATPALPSSRQLEAPAHPHERRLEREARKPSGSFALGRRFERQMSALRWATAVATLLFVFFVSVDVLGNINTGGDDDDDAAFTSAAQSAAPESAGASAATATTSNTSAGIMMATTVPEDTARNTSQEPTPASGSDDESTGGGSQPQPTPASGATGATAAQGTAEEEVTPASAGVEPTAEDATMSEVAPTESVQGYAPDQDSTTSALTGQATEESQESSTLNLIELALVILIAWLLVALIALPRLRRPPA